MGVRKACEGKRLLSQSQLLCTQRSGALQNNCTQMRERDKVSESCCLCLWFIGHTHTKTNDNNKAIKKR